MTAVENNGIVLLGDNEVRVWHLCEMEEGDNEEFRVPSIHLPAVCGELYLRGRCQQNKGCL